MKAYIQRIEKEIPDDWIYAAWLGFRKLGAKIIFFEDQKEIPEYDDDLVVVGYIEDTLAYFKRHHINLSRSLILPPNPNWTKRKIKYTPVKYIKESIKKGDITFPCFFKPVDVKLFPSGVVNRLDTIQFILNDYPNNFCMTSEVVDILSEYRVFVKDGEILGLQWYSGDFSVFPDYDFIKDIVKEYYDKISRYTSSILTMDFGVTSDRGTILIELNDMFSVANYGFDPKTYSLMLRDRFIQLMNKVSRRKVQVYSNNPNHGLHPIASKVQVRRFVAPTKSP